MQEFSKGGFIAAMAAVLGACVSSGDSREGLAPQAANIVVLVADDLGIAYAPCLSADKKMPRMEARCSSAVVFTKAVAHPSCTASRASMMTGRHPFRTHAANVNEHANKVALDEVTIPEIIRARSAVPYRFAAFGKWHLGDSQNGDKANPNRQGFDYFEGNSRQHHSYEYFNYSWEIDGSVVDETVSTYKTTKIADSVIAHFEAHRDEGPWLYWVGFVSPHLPFHLPPTELHSFDDLPDRRFVSVFVPPANDNEVRINRPAPKVLPYYLAMTEALDTEIERMTKRLKALSSRPTIFVLLGDNGDAGEVAPTNTHALIRAKATLYQPGVRVPLMVWTSDERLNEKIARRTARLVHLADIFPTLAEIAGVPRDALATADKPIDGVTFYNDIFGGKRQAAREFVYNEEGDLDDHAYAYSATDKQGRKLIVRELDRAYRFKGETLEFYDLDKDPAEVRNLYPAICRDNPELFWRMFDFIADLHATEPNPMGGIDPARYQSIIDPACRSARR